MAKCNQLTPLPFKGLDFNEEQTASGQQFVDRAKYDSSRTDCMRLKIIFLCVHETIVIASLLTFVANFGVVSKYAQCIV